jgi:hypothetical protein
VPLERAGVSRRALRMARIVDRLPRGMFVIRLEKPGVRGGEWRVEVMKAERVREVEVR